MLFKQASRRQLVPVRRQRRTVVYLFIARRLDRQRARRHRERAEGIGEEIVCRDVRAARLVHDDDVRHRVFARADVRDLRGHRDGVHDMPLDQPRLRVDHPFRTGERRTVVHFFQRKRTQRHAARRHRERAFLQRHAVIRADVRAVLAEHGGGKRVPALARVDAAARDADRKRMPFKQAPLRQLVPVRRQGGAVVFLVRARRKKSDRPPRDGQYAGREDQVVVVRLVFAVFVQHLHGEFVERRARVRYGRTERGFDPVSERERAARHRILFAGERRAVVYLFRACGSDEQIRRFDGERAGLVFYFIIIRDVRAVAVLDGHGEGVFDRADVRAAARNDDHRLVPFPQLPVDERPCVVGVRRAVIDKFVGSGRKDELGLRGVYRAARDEHEQHDEQHRHPDDGGADDV